MFTFSKYLPIRFVYPNDSFPPDHPIPSTRPERRDQSPHPPSMPNRSPFPTNTAAMNIGRSRDILWKKPGRIACTVVRRKHPPILRSSILNPTPTRTHPRVQRIHQGHHVHIYTPLLYNCAHRHEQHSVLTATSSIYPSLSQHLHCLIAHPRSYCLQQRLIPTSICKVRAGLEGSGWPTPDIDKRTNLRANSSALY